MAKKLTFIYKNSELGDVVLAEGVLGENIIDADGNYYVSKEIMQNLDRLQVDKDAYTCPYKGHCDYYDLYDEQGNLVKKMATWSYPKPNPGWEHISERFGFPQSSGMNEIEIVVEEQE